MKTKSEQRVYNAILMTPAIAKSIAEDMKHDTEIRKHWQRKHSATYHRNHRAKRLKEMREYYERNKPRLKEMMRARYRKLKNEASKP